MVRRARTRRCGTRSTVERRLGRCGLKSFSAHSADCRRVSSDAHRLYELHRIHHGADPRAGNVATSTFLEKPTLSLAVFSALLKRHDARRAADVAERLLADGFRGALTGSLSTEAQLRAHGRPIDRRGLNDLDFVIDSFKAIPASLADRFLIHHIHPHASEGKTLLQTIDKESALRVDLFRAFGTTLTRANVVDEQTGGLLVLAVEDLVARSTAHVCGRLRQGRPIDAKYVRAFARLTGLGESARLADAWRDHQQEVPGTLEEATQWANERLVRFPDLVVRETYSAVVTACDQCRDCGPFRRAAPDLIVSILGYW